MATHKTFAKNEILTSNDVNDYLNPASAEVIPYAVAAGTVTVQAASGSPGVGSTPVTFPSGRFSATPVITVSAHSGAATVVNAQINNPTADGFDAVLLRNNTVETTIHWIAVQMTPTSGQG